jgi:hypothetical protein
MEAMPERLTSLPFLFTAIAIVEAVYAALGLLTPPGLVTSVTGWVLTPDGQWVVKLLSAALGFQALIAWMFRDNPHLGIAWALAAYQLLAATIDWTMWISLGDQGIFSTPLAQLSVGVSVVLHYALGILLIVAIRKTAKHHS